MAKHNKNKKKTKTQDIKTPKPTKQTREVPLEDVGIICANISDMRI